MVAIMKMQPYPYCGHRTFNEDRFIIVSNRFDCICYVFFVGHFSRETRYDYTKNQWWRLKKLFNYLTEITILLLAQN